jgi:site-specific DNA recombinase
MRAALYARFSTDLQRKESVDDQFRQCEKTAREHGLEIVSRYSDAGISGGTTDRPGYQAMLSAARRREFDVLIAEDISRLWRNRAEFGGRSAELEDLGVHLLTAVGDDTRRDGWGLLIAIKSAIAEHMRKETSYRTRRALEGLALAGKSTGGRTYGFPSPNVRPEAVAQQRLIVKRIFEEAAAGRGPYAIANGLNKDRIYGPRCRHWEGITVKRILRNARYAGRLAWGATVTQGGAQDSRRTRHIRRPDGPLVERSVEPVVSQELWCAAQREAVL